MNIPKFNGLTLQDIKKLVASGAMSYPKVMDGESAAALVSVLTGSNVKAYAVGQKTAIKYERKTTGYHKTRDNTGGGIGGICGLRSSRRRPPYQDLD